jgi:hypothetical protein
MCWQRNISCAQCRTSQVAVRVIADRDLGYRIWGGGFGVVDFGWRSASALRVIVNLILGGAALQRCDKQVILLGGFSR